MRWALRFLAVVSVVACGKSGDGAGDGVAPDDDGGVVTPEVTDVSGTFHLGDESAPAAGFQLWLVDHSSFGIERIPLSETGGFSMPVERFTEGHVYSLHVVKDYVLYGDVDFAPDTEGTQAAFVYAGGYGFDVGDVTLALDGRGVLARGANALAGSLGGGFALSSEDGRLPNAAPSFTSAVVVGSQLVVMEPSVLLSSFYRAEDYPDLFARDLAAYSRVGVRVEASDLAAISKVVVAETGPWLKGARRATTDNVSPSRAPFWSASGYGLSASDRGFESAAYPGSVLGSGTLLGLKLTPVEGPQEVVWRVIDTVLSRPPRVLAADTAGTTAATIDYASTSTANGLTRPFCLSGDVQLAVEPPRDGAGDVVVDGTFDHIDVEIDFYGAAADPSAPLAVDPALLAAPFNEAIDGVTGDLPWAWDPTVRRLRVTLDQVAQGAASHALTISSGLLTATIGDVDVYNIRFRIYYRSTSGGAEGGTAFWIDRKC